ncbi:unnamed protein product [Adineta ricciae]|uniref:Uncharacterized protein n=1 Tax=Adineta ricciae TaxID=249248 RepID=A0A815TJH0_ADIRI|nr:unnamed protein product [Adineta ricciae]CAF1503862.1 unnamed protein product [Adineta ricciae]
MNIFLGFKGHACIANMERPLVMYQLGDTNLTNADMSRKFRQDLGFEYFRRVSTKKGKSIFYLFYTSEMNTYDALVAAKRIKYISVVRYQPRNRVLPPPAHLDEFPCDELPFHPGHCPKIVNFLRSAFSKHIEKFPSRRLFKLLIHRLADQTDARKLRFIGGICKNGCVEWTDGGG